MYIDFLYPGNIATFLLTFLAGLLISKLIKSRGIGGCFIYILAIVVVVILITALWKGYSYFIERITYNLETYISYNIIGIVGLIAGLLLGLLLFRKP